MPLYLPAPLVTALWAHAEREAPRECVGALGGLRLDGPAERVQAHAAYPLPNVAPRPEADYLADPGALVRALRGMQARGLEMVALYHSHPRGPARPSARDVQLAAYGVPYLIADLSRRELRAYHLPEGREVEVVCQLASPESGPAGEHRAGRQS